MKPCTVMPLNLLCMVIARLQRTDNYIEDSPFKIIVEDVIYTQFIAYCIQFKLL